MYTQTININLIPQGVPPVVHVNQYEYQTDALRFNLFNGDEVFNIPSNAAVIMNGLKPDGNVFSFSAASTSGNTAVFNCEQQMVPIAGQTLCELRVRTLAEIIGTCNFILQVEEAPLHDDSVISETMIPLIEQAIDIAANLAEYIETTLEAKNTAVTSAANAKESENNAYIYNSNVEQMYNSLESVKQAANTAAAGARSIAEELQTKLDAGYFKGDKGDKGDTGESGIITPIMGLFAMSVENDGDLYVYSDDSNDIAENFEYDSETGNLNYIFNYTESEPEPDPVDPEEP